MKLFLLFLTLLFAFSGFTQQYSFTNYTVDDGLAQSQINEIIQDEWGYLWIGTESGLSKFNGLDFTNYSMGNGLPDNKVEKIFFDQDRIMWVGTPKGLARFDEDKFIPYFFKEPLRVNDIDQFQGKLFIATNTGLYVLNDDHFEQIPFKDDAENLYIRALQILDDNTLVCGTKTGIYSFDGANYTAFKDSSFLQYNISDLDMIRNELIFSTFGEGVWNYHLKKDSLYQYPLDFNRIRSMYVHDEVILCSTISGGVEITNERITYFTQENGLINERLICSYIDRENNYWLGTDGNGILKFLGKSITSFSVEDGLSSNIVMSISQYPDSTFVFGTYREGLNEIDFNKEYVFHLHQKNGLKDNSVWTTVVDKQGRCWVGTSKGVHCLEHGKLTENKVSKEINAKIRSIVIENNHYYFGGTSGIYRYDGTNVHFLEETKNMNINQLYVENGTLYVASRNGLFAMSTSNSVVQIDTIKIPETNINSVVVDDRKNLWIGTENGLYVKLPEHGVVPFDLDRSDFKSKTILGLIKSKDHNIWVSTMSGVYRISGNEQNLYDYRLFRYGTAEGLINLESNHNALYEDYSGNIWVGTSVGLARIDPSLDHILFDFKSPELHFTGIRLFMEGFDYDRFEVSYGTNKEVPNAITLPYNQNHLTFDFIGINLKNPESVLYEYRLVGAHDSWSPLSQAKYATYSDVAPGEYEFQVRATNKSFIWSEIKHIQITVLPPFWKTWWFTISLSLFGFLLILLIFQVRIKAIKQKQENEKLGYKNRLLFLEQQSLNASMNRHFIFNSLNSIQYFINSSDKLSANKYLSSFAKLIRKNLDSSTSNNFIVSLQEEIERIQLYLSLEKMRFQEKFDYEINVAADLDTEEIEIPSMILQPFVENSIIHGVLPLEDRMGKIHINIFKELGDVVFEVSDDGVGIDSTLQRKKDPMTGDHDSKGMEITNRRIELLRKLTGDHLMIIGPYQLNDTSGKPIGTKVIIKMGMNLNPDG
ncbi:MAG: two-component regulator propeller domain-containing protein [Crocinitomicaceae bacterium]